MYMARVAYISADFGVPIFGTKGCSIHAQEVLRAMRQRGANVQVFSTSTEGERREELENLPVHALPRPRKGDAAERERFALAGNEHLRSALEAAAPFDMVYERYSLWTYAGMEWARVAAVPGVLEVNAPLIDEQARYRVLVDRAAAEQSAQRSFEAASALLAVSDEVASWLETYASARGKVHVIPNGVDANRFPEGLAATLPAPGVFTVGFVGTLKSWHGLEILLQAFDRLHQTDPNTRLVIVGDGPERGHLQADVAARSLQNATVFTEAVPPTGVPGLLASMDAAVAPYPALQEFYFSPLKVYEYMAAGLPVVASSIGQLRKVIEPGLNGLLVTPGDVSALTSALQYLKQNPQVRRRLGFEARKTVLRSYTWERVVDRVFGLAGLTAGEKCEPAAIS